MLKIKSLINFILLQPNNILLCLIMIFNSIYLQRNGFYFHVIGVTLLLLIILHKINLCYDKIENKYILYEYIVIIGGILHTIVPLISLKYSLVMYIHIGICFIVHILHLSQCYLIFYDIKMKDTYYIIILWAVNIMEFFVNLTFCFPEVIPNKLFVVPLVVVEISALLLSQLKLKSIHQSNYHNTNTSATTTTTTTNTTTNYSGVSRGGRENELSNGQQSSTIFQKIQSIMTSRIMIAILCTTISGSLIAFKNYNFQIFMTGFTILLIVNFSHLHNHTITVYPVGVTYIGIFTFFSLILINWLFFIFLPSYKSLAALLLLICSLPILSMNLIKYYYIMGYHYLFYMTCFGISVYILTIILYGLHLTKDNNIYFFEGFMVSSVIYSMAMILTDYKIVRGKRIHVNGISESKHSSDGTHTSGVGVPPPTSLQNIKSSKFENATESNY